MNDQRIAALIRRSLLVALPLVLVTTIVGSAAAQGSAFTYQGQLKDGGVPASGNYDLSFSMWDDPAAGNQVGPTVNLPGSAVTGGLFTVELDFGAVFSGAPLWLEIAVNSTPLTPRQAMTSTPYCQTAAFANAPWVTSGAGLYYDDGNVGIGTAAPTSKLDVRGIFTLDAGGDAGIATGTGAGELNRYLSLFNSLQFPSASGLRAGGVLVSDDYFYANPAKTDLVVKGKVSIGTATANYPLTIRTSALFGSYGLIHTDGTREMGTYVSSTGGWLGTRSNHPLNFFTNDSNARVTLSADGALGVGTTNPSAFAQFAVFGSGTNRAGYFESSRGGLTGWSTSNGFTGITGGNGAGGVGVFSVGELAATGTKSFRIDHPLDPENKYLTHFCAEGPEPLNVYRGNVTLDAAGQAWVTLPDYFAEINRDPSYQLTPIGESAPVFVKQKIVNNRFLVAGGKAGMEVSWRVEAVRNDRFVKRYGAAVESAKPADKIGTYLQPELYGQPAEKGQFYQARPAELSASREPAAANN